MLGLVSIGCKTVKDEHFTLACNHFGITDGFFLNRSSTHRPRDRTSLTIQTGPAERLTTQ